MKKIFLNTTDINRPKIEVTEKATKEHTEFLNNLRESGATNMFGAGKYLELEFSLRPVEAREILADWMQNFKA